MTESDTAMAMKDERRGIAGAAHQVGCSEWTLRRLDYQGIVRPARDPWGRRLYTAEDIALARRYLAERTERNTRPAGLPRG